MLGGICCSAVASPIPCCRAWTRTRPAAAGDRCASAARCRSTTACVAATSASEMSAAAPAKMATATTCVAAAAPATVLGESRMRGDGEDGSESKCGKEPPSRRRSGRNHAFGRRRKLGGATASRERSE
jgi:hypothetical protein